MDERAETLRGRIAALGFDEVRFAAVEPPPPGLLRSWLSAGHHADMHWMERTAERRLAPERVVPGVRSIILLGVNYWNGEAKAGPPTFARYARYRDYHDTLKPALVRAGRALEEIYGAGVGDYRYYVDTGPVLERGWAARAGMGFVGKNAMLISRRHGNWLFLAAILTRVDLPPDEPVRPGGDHRLCGKCTRCLDACPTRAFPAPGVVDARRCISYQTIENRGVIPRELRPGIGGRVFGCDVCLEVCPWNRFAREGRRVLLEARAEFAAFGWRELLELTPGRFAAVFGGTAVKRLKHAGLLRNACVGAGNSGDSTLIEPLIRLASHALPLIRIHAVWAAYRLAGTPRAVELLHAARAEERDRAVLDEYAAGETGG